jgi:hypothetical protein
VISARDAALRLLMQICADADICSLISAADADICSVCSDADRCRYLQPDADISLLCIRIRLQADLFHT